VASVGQSVPTAGPTTRFGFVQSHAPKPRRHLAEVLDGQGLQHNQELIFLSDGEESLRQLQCYLRPHSRHLLDWFHLTMQLTGLGQSLRGLTRLDPERTAELQEALEHTKGNLWHGKVKRAHAWLRLPEGHMWHLASRYAKFSALARAVHGFQRHLWRNAELIPKLRRPTASRPDDLDGVRGVAGRCPAQQALRQEAGDGVDTGRCPPPPAGAHADPEG
jgi:hypothetical protein